MSAARWRRAMSAGVDRSGRPSAVAGPAAAAYPAGTRRWPGSAASSAASSGSVAAGPAARAGPDGAAQVSAWGDWLRRHVRARHLLVLAMVLVYPAFATPFFTFQVGAQALALGLIALSLAFLAGYGGMVSLSQMTVAGVAGYMVAIFGASSVASISLGWPWWLGAAFAVVVATAFGTLVGWLSVRTAGIYTIMITLAIGVAFFYLAQQNYALFNGFQGFNQVSAPVVAGLDFRRPVPFYYLALACALAAYFFVKYLARAPFGIALQGIRDNPRRMESLGYAVTAHRVAAHAVAALLAAVGGVLMVWYNGRISPGSIGTGAMINVLVVAVLGGMKHPIGAFVGAVVFVLLQNFAIDLVDRERFNLVIGGVFLLIVLFSPDGLLGLWSWLRARVRTAGDRWPAAGRSGR